MQPGDVHVRAPGRAITATQGSRMLPKSASQVPGQHQGLAPGLRTQAVCLHGVLLPAQRIVPRDLPGPGFAGSKCRTRSAGQRLTPPLTCDCAGVVFLHSLRAWRGPGEGGLRSPAAASTSRSWALSSRCKLSPFHSLFMSPLASSFEFPLCLDTSDAKDVMANKVTQPVSPRGGVRVRLSRVSPV